MDSDEFQIKEYIKTALECGKFSHYEITLADCSEKSGGYVGKLMFATVSATTAEGITENIEVAIKTSKKSFLNGYRNIYKREAYFYTVILPEFNKFQIENNIRDIFNSVPKFYKAISEASAEALVMENLNKSRYRLYDRKKPLDLNHLNFVLREYAKFHAISFALREKKPDTFKKLVTDFVDVALEVVDENFKKMMHVGMKRTCDILGKMDDVQTYNLCHKLLQEGPDKVLTDILGTTEPDSAVLHGDCWNNNFVYKYENEESKYPSKVAILDWQFSRLHSPVLDLSYFIYSTSSVEQLQHFDELLDIYYDSFSMFLKKFDCVAEELFPFSTLKRHWKKYAIFGVLMVTTSLHLLISDTEELPKADEAGDEADISETVMNTEIKDQSEFQKRLVVVVSHYCKYIK